MTKLRPFEMLSVKVRVNPINDHIEFLDGFARNTVHWFQDNKPRRNPLINTCDMLS
jgi:hypothetical protein